MFLCVLFQIDEIKTEKENKNEGQKAAAATAAADGGGKKDDSPITVLKLDLHCEGCAKKVKRSVRQFEGLKFSFLCFFLRYKPR